MTDVAGDGQNRVGKQNFRCCEYGGRFVLFRKFVVVVPDDNIIDKKFRHSFYLTNLFCCNLLLHHYMPIKTSQSILPYTTIATTR